jgi:hypothetical protein
VARWHLRSGPFEVWTQYFRYARGDAQAGMYPERHALRFAAYTALAAVLASRKTWPKVAVAAGGIAYARRSFARAMQRLPSGRERAAASIAVPLTLLWLDVAKMAGYAAGLADRLLGRVQPRSPYS